MAKTKTEGLHMIIHDHGYDLRARATLLGSFPGCSGIHPTCSHFTPSWGTFGTALLFFAPTLLIG